MTYEEETALDNATVEMTDTFREEATGIEYHVNALGPFTPYPREVTLRSAETGETIETTAPLIMLRVRVKGGWTQIKQPTPECLEAGDDCAGEVAFHSYGARLIAFPRCAKHHADRLAKQPHIDELTSPIRAAWFSEADAGERWSDDDE